MTGRWENFTPPVTTAEDRDRIEGVYLLDAAGDLARAHELLSNVDLRRWGSHPELVAQIKQLREANDVPAFRAGVIKASRQRQAARKKKERK